MFPVLTQACLWGLGYCQHMACCLLLQATSHPVGAGPGVRGSVPGLGSSMANRAQASFCPANSAKCAPGGGSLVTVQHDVENSAGGSAHRQGGSGIHMVLHSAQASLPVHLELLLFLSRDAFLVPLPPGWVMQVAKCLIPSCDSRGAEKLEPSSFDAPVELIVLTAPAPEAVGHPVALTQRQAGSCFLVS